MSDTENTPVVVEEKAAVEETPAAEEMVLWDADNKRSGFLVKQGGGTRTVVGRSSWKNRWFVLNKAEGSLAVCSRVIPSKRARD